MLNFHNTRLFLDVSFFPLQLILFFDLFFLSFCICTAFVQDQVINFLPVGLSFRLIINQSIWIWLFLTSFRAEVCEEQEWRVGLTYVPTTACIRCGASSRKRHGNRHAKSAGLRVPVRPNLRKFLVKCSTSGGFFVNFYTLFFSTTSSVLLKKV